MARYKKGSVHPELYRFFENSGPESFDFLMTRITENDAASLYKDSSDGIIRCIVLSGYKSGDNTGASTEPIDGKFDSEGNFRIAVLPLNKIGQQFGSVESFFSRSEEEVVESIFDVMSVFYPKADYGYDASSPVNFGQYVDCYFEDGSEINSDFRNMNFQSPPDPPVYHPSALASIGIAINSSASGSFAGSSPSTLGDLSEGGIDPRYPPREWIYVGTNENYLNQKLQNGNLPEDLLGKATKGGKFKPKMLAEMVPLYDQMCEDFRKAFPTKQLSAWGYRPYSRQLSLKVEKPNLAAKPGTSNHGWGQAIDVHYYEDGASEASKLLYSKPEYIWLKENSKKYGWYNPAWASQGGSKEEPWHWEASPSKFKRN